MRVHYRLLYSSVVLPPEFDVRLPLLGREPCVTRATPNRNSLSYRLSRELAEACVLLDEAFKRDISTCVSASEYIGGIEGAVEHLEGACSRWLAAHRERMAQLAGSEGGDA